MQRGRSEQKIDNQLEFKLVEVRFKLISFSDFTDMYYNLNDPSPIQQICTIFKGSLIYFYNICRFVDGTLLELNMRQFLFCLKKAS